MNVIEIKVPSIGESVTEVTLAKWLVEDGAKVKLDQALCEFESDKATFELPAEKAGRIKRLANEGDDLSVGAVVAQIDVSVSEKWKRLKLLPNHQKLLVPKPQQINWSSIQRLPLPN